MAFITNLKFAYDNILNSLFLKRKKVYILCYHSISNDNTIIDVKIEEFKKQVEYLSRKYDFITLSKAVDHIAGNKLPKNPSVAITFDDGYADLLTNALPILKKYNAPATIFFIADKDRANRAELENNKELLNVSDLSEFLEAGWEIGCHTMTHPNLISVPNSDLKAEITEARNLLSKLLKNSVDFFAYPKGLYNKHVLEECREANFYAAFTVEHKLIPKDCDLLTIPRISIDRTHSVWKFKLMFYSPIQLYLKLKSFKQI